VEIVHKRGTTWGRKKGGTWEIGERKRTWSTAAEKKVEDLKKN